MSTIIATKAIKRIELVENVVNPYFRYQEKVKVFGVTIKKAGFYELIFFNGWTKVDEAKIKAQFILKDNIVYYKPYVKVYIEGDSITKTFDTNSDARMFMFLVERAMHNPRFYSTIDLDDPKNLKSEMDKYVWNKHDFEIARMYVKEQISNQKQ